MNKFTLPKLTYAYDALVPYINAKTMEIHHTQHHQGYVNKLNAALEEEEEYSYQEDLITLLSEVDRYTSAIRNNAGGHYNHTLFWESLGVQEKKKPKGSLKDAIERSFSSFTAFQNKFNKKAAGLFGSGWAWVCVEDSGRINVHTTPNQDNPLMPYYNVGTPILGLDVWEHAYYLQYQNRRPDYITAFWHIIDWEVIEERYLQTLSS